MRRTKRNYQKKVFILMNAFSETNSMVPIDL